MSPVPSTQPSPDHQRLREASKRASNTADRIAEYMNSGSIDLYVAESSLHITSALVEASTAIETLEAEVVSLRLDKGRLGRTLGKVGSDLEDSRRTVVALAAALQEEEAP